MFQTSLHVASKWRGSLILAVAALAAAVPALPQSKPSAQSSSPSGEYSILEINPFAGYQWFQIYAKDEPRVGTWSWQATMALNEKYL